MTNPCYCKWKFLNKKAKGVGVVGGERHTEYASHQENVFFCCFYIVWLFISNEIQTDQHTPLLHLIITIYNLS